MTNDEILELGKLAIREQDGVLTPAEQVRYDQLMNMAVKTTYFDFKRLRDSSWWFNMRVRLVILRENIAWRFRRSL